MNRRIFGVLIVLLCLCFCQGCYSDGTPSQNTEATTIEIDQTESNYIIKTDYKYYIGFIFVDYCINHLGGLAQFLSAYCDSATVPNLYGKTVDKIVKEACAYNTFLFYKTQKTD